MALTIIDTDILIDFARADQKAAHCLQAIQQKSILAISSITQMELVVDCRNKTELKDLEKFIQRFQVLPITDEISDRAYNLLTQYYLSHGLLIPDALIAATALIHDEEFITKNQRDFRFVVGLSLLPY